jgi:hypothetical protein
MTINPFTGAYMSAVSSSDAEVEGPMDGRDRLRVVLGGGAVYFHHGDDSAFRAERHRQ